MTDPGTRDIVVDDDPGVTAGPPRVPAGDPVSLSQAETVIQPSRNWALGLSGLWEYRGLTGVLAWRDIKVRYKQTFFGAGWAVIQPVMLMVVFGIFFGRLAGLPSDGLPYPVFVLAALVPWTFFANAFLNSSQSVVENQNIISKVYFPRLILPVATALSFLMDFVIALGVLVVLEAVYGDLPDLANRLRPAARRLRGPGGTVVGVFLAALNVRYRDVPYTVPFLIQLWLFASPIGYPSTLIPRAVALPLRAESDDGRDRGLPLERRRRARPIRAPLVLVSLVVSLVFLVTGLLYFGRTERTFADMI